MRLAIGVLGFVGVAEGGGCSEVVRAKSVCLRGYEGWVGLHCGFRRFE
jgi:hypothetical protein